ncbi:MAG TPA: hypothetical protein RMH26_00300, partial [Polyangiaceae bacterium LLY-WYZ-15_(1-7)]|nr:hypothetical protein [Polyangiaceae bacterium LLY-WYZ-15_(1-7)]
MPPPEGALPESMLELALEPLPLELLPLELLPALPDSPPVGSFGCGWGSLAAGSRSPSMFGCGWG